MANKSLAILSALILNTALAQDAPIRDPFTTLNKAAVVPVAGALIEPGSNAPSGLLLRAVLWSDAPLADISGMIVAPGDKVSEYTVDRIDQHSVSLRRGEDRVLLTLPKDN